MAAGLCGTWDMVSNVNFDGYMVALGVSTTLRKAAVKLKQKKVIEEKGGVCCIKTLSALRNYTCSFTVGHQFDEVTKGLDNQRLKSLVRWEGEKLVCEQIGQKQNRGWAHWIEDGKLQLELFCEGQVCRQVFRKKESEKDGSCKSDS
ncbi:retinoid-binding protein 7a [Gadus morhua]|uniref:Cellular retinoic acid-binding protein 1 n=1 Tax=Gadus morhua TaxID=8049 RepID=A0A8C4YVJ4_GADMO|nr:retinoid-binding protein 7 [Gadus morhua]XP_059915953.1 retinoid-binding protein 7a [Gadus macrocephalus]